MHWVRRSRSRCHIYQYLRAKFYRYHPVPSLAVKSYFCTFIGTTNPVRLPVTPKHGPSTIFMSPIGCNPYGDSILLITLSISSPKVAKNDKNPGFVLPIFKITFVLNFR